MIENEWHHRCVSVRDRLIGCNNDPISKDSLVLVLQNSHFHVASDLTQMIDDFGVV